MKSMKAKILVLLALSVLGQLAFAADEKKYTQKEFDEALHKQVEEEVKKSMLKIGRGTLADFANELIQKENTLKVKELELKKYQEQIDLSGTKFEERVKKFNESQAGVLGCIESHSKEEQKRMTHMVDAVSGMRPASAADVLAAQEPDIAVRILGALTSEKVSKIFNSMDKEISARLQKQYLSMKK